MKIIRLCDVLDYEQPSKYIVNSEQYSDEYIIPVLTAGKSFILGYTNETEGIYNATKDNPIILFDDFTTDCRYIDFNFKVKSSAVKILKLKGNDNNLKYLYYILKNIIYDTSSHKRYWISQYSKFKVKLPNIEIQNEIVKEMEKIENLIENKRKQMQKFKELVKSQFIEMFDENTDILKVDLQEVCTSIVRGPFGSMLKKEFFVERSESTYKVYEQKNAIESDWKLGKYYITEQKFKELKRFECKPNDIIMSCSGTIGKLYQFPKEMEKGIINQALLKLTLDDKKILSKYFIEWFNNNLDKLDTKGSGLQNMSSVKTLKTMEIPLPSIELQKKFTSFIENIEKQKKICNKIIDKLKELKECKMQEYLGGVINE